MHRRINFLSISILLSFVTIFSVAINAQDKFRLSRPLENNLDSQSSYSNNASNSQNDSNFHVNLPPNNNSQSSPIKGNIDEETQPGQLTQVQIQKLAAHDIILLIDKSGSMATPDCPSDTSLNLKSILPSVLMGGNIKNSRWQWCRNQTAQMSNLTQQFLPSGFTVLLFDSGCYLFPHVSSTSLALIFANNNPGGSTNLALPLDKVFRDYFKRKKLSNGKIKPLLIGIITDGCPDSPQAVTKMLADLTHSLDNPNEITVVFFLIGGHDSAGEKFARNLSQNLFKAGASFNIVKEVPFEQVQELGLVQALANNLD